MTFVHNLWTDLVEKRLWPVLVVLLVALVAVPVVLGSGGEEPVDAASLGATGATGSLGSQAQVSLGEPGATRLDREGRLRDPFKQQAFPRAAGGRAAGTKPGGIGTDGSPPAPDVAPPGGNGPTGPKPAGGGDPPGGGSSGGGGTPGGSSGAADASGGKTTPKSDAKPSAPELSDYVTEIRVGRLGESRPRRTVARLTPLPTVERPFFVYLGVLTDRRTAVFLLSSDVKASGQAKCKPDKDICETIEMRQGQTTTLAVTNDDDSISEYRLTVDEVRRRGTASREAAPAAADTKPAAKRSSSEEDLGTARYRYDDRTGLLRRVRASRSGKPAARRLGAEGASVSDLLTGRGPRRPGLPEVACRRC